MDGHSLAYRAFFALPVDNFSTKDGQHTNGIYGFLSMLINLIKAEKPTHLAVAFDTSRQSFRTREYAEYKANRSESPSEFKGQIPLLQECLAAMSISVLHKEDFEADDILATLATQGAEQGFDVLVCSGDRDTIQLVNDDITLLYPNVQGVSQLKRYDTAAVIERYGVRPEQYPDIAALVGETSDNLPGVPKVGEKTAVKWLGQFGSLDALLENADKVGGVVGGNLREHLDDVRRNRTLNRLLRDVELPVTIADLEVQPMDAQAVRDIFARLEFKTLIPRVAELAGIEQQMASISAAAAVLAPVPGEPAPDELAAWLAAADREVGVTIVIENGLPGRVGFATRDAAAKDAAVEATWSPEVAASVGPWLASDAPKVFSDAKPQVKALSRAGIRVGGLAFDTIVTGWLLRPSFPDKTLADLVDRYLDEKLPESDPTQLVPETEGATPGQLSWYTLRVADALRGELAPSVAAVLTDIELPTLLTLADMELAGVAVSHEKLSEFSADLGLRADAIAQQAFAAIGREVNLGSPKQLQEVLFEELQLPKTRKTKTGYSTDAAVLADLQETNPHPFLDLLLQHREATKLRQIIESLDTAIAADGRIRTTYVQTGSQTGRLSSTDPNLQNIPVRTEESRRIRAAFEVGEGYETLLTADYSQIEMRIMAHLSEDPGPDRGVQLRRGPAPLRRRARVRRRTAGRHRRDAHEGQGDVVRTRLRAVGVRPVQAAAHRAGRGQAAHDGVLPPLRRRARLPALVGRAGEDRRLHRDDLRPPAPVPRPGEPQPRAARERRAGRAQRADPGERRRHHEDRAVPHPRRLRRGEAALARAHADPRRARRRDRAGRVGCRGAHRPRADGRRGGAGRAARRADRPRPRLERSRALTGVGGVRLLA